jgi:hypothetical protein
MQEHSKTNDPLSSEDITKTIKINNKLLMSIMLAMAIDEEYLEGIQRLVDAGADIYYDICDELMPTPLDHAIHKQNDAIKKILEPHFTDAMREDWNAKSELLAPYTKKRSPRLSESGLPRALHNTSSGSDSASQSEASAEEALPEEESPAQDPPRQDKCCTML